MLHAVCPSPTLNFNLGPYQVIFIISFKILVYSSSWRRADLCSPFITLCLMPYASRSRAYRIRRIIHKIFHAKIIRSSLLPLLRGSPCERGVTLAQFRVNYMSPPLIRGGPLLVVAWFAHAQSRRIFFHRGKISFSQFFIKWSPDLFPRDL